MQKIGKVVAACVAATVLIALAAVPAAARSRIEISTTAILASGRLTFAPNEEFAPELICDLTFHATAVRLIGKVRGAAIGSVTAILTANPRSSFGTNPTCIPLAGMAASYDSIRGTLPSITGGALLVRGSYLISVVVFGTRVACLYANELLASGGENPFVRLQMEAPAPLVRTLEGPCPSEATLFGTLTLSPTVTIRLLER